MKIKLLSFVVLAVFAAGAVAHGHGDGKPSGETRDKKNDGPKPPDGNRGRGNDGDNRGRGHGTGSTTGSCPPNNPNCGNGGASNPAGTGTSLGQEIGDDEDEDDGLPAQTGTLTSGQTAGGLPLVPDAPVNEPHGGGGAVDALMGALQSEAANPAKKTGVAGAPEVRGIRDAEYSGGGWSPRSLAPTALEASAGPMHAALDAAATRDILMRAPNISAVEAGMSRADRARRHSRNARREFGLKNWRGAIEEATKALEQDPQNLDAYVIRASAELKIKELQAAERDALAALRIDPKNIEAWTILARARYGLGNYAAALEAVNIALSLSPNDPALYYLRAQIQARLGDRAGALASAAMAAKLAPGKYAAAYEKFKQGGALPEDDSLFEDMRADRGGGIPPGLAAALAGGAVLLLIGGATWKLAKPRQRSLLEPLASPAATDGSKLLAGKFEAIRVIGRGGMGEVLEAMDRSLGRPVAIKRMPARLAEIGPKVREMMLKEARMVANLKHPGIVDLYEVIEQGDDIFLVFELLRGKTAAQILAEERQLRVDRAAEMLGPVCDALAFAHSQHVVHRDLKPQNIMVTDQGWSKLMDFGIARVTGASTAEPSAAPVVLPGQPGFQFDRTRTVAGTPQYMSPEMERGVVCPEADVYSLGVCLYELLTGVRPFPEPATAAVKLATRITRPSARVSGLPRAIDELIGQSLQPSPEKRLRTAAEFGRRLKAAAAPGVPA